MSRNDLLRYWPSEDDVRACVKTDAEASSEAVSLAVHQPMRFERRVIGGDQLGDCDEHELLREFLSQDLPEGRVILPVVGSSGVGKSHVVRWLDAQIRRLPGAEKRVVIRIPKGTSLKGVLGILLKEVQGPAYDAHRRELTRAQQELDPKEAAGLLCEMLAHTLGEMHEQARGRLLSNPADKSAQEIVAYCRADMLPALLRNQLLRDHHFVRSPTGGDGVVKRLVEQLTEGRSAGSNDDRQHLFSPSDLVVDGIERDALGRAEERALAQFGREDRRVTATRILNAALDDAKQRLLRLDPTVSDLFDAVRRQLLKDGKELVLLVEDFAVLSGIQKQLLQVIIKEAIRDGRPVLCTMRTAIAYTTGYLDTATVLTRAHVEYRIPDEPGTEEEILTRISRLVAAYLNAARLGQDGLERAYGSFDPASLDLQSWIPHFKANIEPEARATLDAFGSSTDDLEFFPFNRSAIDELAREGCLQAGRFIYNPRFVIQNIINRVLVHRELFEQGSFPPATFGSPRIIAKVVEEVRRRVAPSDLDRYLRFLAYWGGLPSNPASIVQTSERVFAAFGLDSAVFGRKGGAATPISPKPVVQPPDQREHAPQPPAPKSAPSNPVEAKWEDTLERWRHGIAIPQADANQLRKWISEAFKESIEWDWDLFRPRRDEWLDHWSASVFIPYAAGHGGRTAADAMVAVCTDEDLADETKSARVHSTLMAIVRFHGVHKGGSWDYEGAEDDLPRYASFIDTHAPTVRAYVRNRYFRAEWDPVRALVHGLLVGARALGMDGADKDGDHGALVNALFAPTSSQGASQDDGRQAPEDPTGWAEFVAALAKCRGSGGKESRDQLSWTGHLLNLLGARQGGGDSVHAIDLVRLKPAIDDTLAGWMFTSSLPNPSGVTELGPVRTAYGELKRLSSTVGKAREHLFNWRTKMVTWLGDGADKESVVRELKGVVDSAKAAGLTSEIDTKRLLQSIESFRLAKVVPALADAAKLDENAPRGTVIAVLGRGYTPVARLCEDLHARYEQFLTCVDGELLRETQQYGDNPVAEAMGELGSELSAVEDLLKEVQK